MFKNRHNFQMISVLGVIVLVTVIICFYAKSCTGENLIFEETYYFVCYRNIDNVISAGSLSDTVSSYGGAGYILEHNGNYYVTISCYYTRDEADSVCTNLKNRDLECSVLQIETSEYNLNNNTKNNKELFLGNLNTLNSLSSIAYECANGLDTGNLSQSNAKSVLSSITDSLKGLLKNNENNCFTESIKNIISDCENIRGYLFSKNMRYIQIALADAIINVQIN